MLFSFMLLFCAVLSVGCQPATNVAIDSSDTPSIGQPLNLVSQVVEASCGECSFGMQGESCDLAVRIDGKSYFVDGSKMDDHGNAHGDDGMCNVIRRAKVTGEVKEGRFVATAFELLPQDGDSAAHDESAPHKH